MWPNEDTPLLMDCNDRSEWEAANDIVETERTNPIPQDTEAGSALLFSAVVNIFIVSFMICIIAVLNNGGNTGIINQVNTFFCLLLWTATSCIIYHSVIMWRHRCIANLESGVEVNYFLLNLTVFFFMPLTQTYLTTQITKLSFLIECLPTSRMLNSVSEMVFVAAVTGYILTLSGKKIVGTISQVRLCRGTIIAVVTTSVCLWIQLLFLDAKHKYEKMMNKTHHYDPNCNVSEVSKQAATNVNTLEPYLMPFMIEFLLASSVLLYIPYRTAEVIGQGNSNITTQDASRQDDGHSRVANNRPVQCKPAPVVVGGVFLISCLFALVVNMPSDLHESALVGIGIKVFNIWSYFTFIFCIICSVMLYMQVRRYSILCEWKSPAERILLWISTCGVFLECVIYIYAISSLLPSDYPDNTLDPLHMKLCLVTYLLKFVQILAQTITLDVSLHRRIQGRNPIFSNIQPALILLLINFGMWADSVYLTEKMNLDDIIIKYFDGYLMYAIVKCLYKPLHILYRIHCVVMHYKLFVDLG